MVILTSKSTQLIRYFTIFSLSIAALLLISVKVEASKSADGNWSCPGDIVPIGQPVPVPGTSVTVYFCEDPVTKKATQATPSAEEQKFIDDQNNTQAAANANQASNNGTCKYISAAFRNVFCFWGSGTASNINTTLTGQNSLISWIVQLLIGLMGIAFVITILVSAIQIMAGGLSPESLTSAKKRLSVAAISLGLLIGLQAIVALIGAP